MAKSIMDQVHERSLNGLGNYSTNAQLREQLQREYGIEILGNRMVAPDGSEGMERMEIRIRQHDRDDSLRSENDEIAKYGYTIPVIYATSPATKQAATITLPDGRTHTVYVPK
jgi:hypothetical protein